MENGRDSSTASRSPHKPLSNGTSRQTKKPAAKAHDEFDNSNLPSSPTLVNGKKRKKL